MGSAQPDRVPCVAPAGHWPVLGQSLLWPVRVYRARQTLHQLSRMNARELRDIGLTPYDVQSAQALPLDADPTHLLAGRARERARNDSHVPLIAERCGRLSADAKV